MATVHVRRLDPDVVERLKRRAAANHRSLESEIRQILGACAAEINLLRKRRIGPYFPDFSANRTTMHLKIVKIWPRFSTFSLRSFLPRRLLAAAAEDQVAAKLESFHDLAARLRRRTQGRNQTPSEVLVRKDRDSGHRVV